MKPSLQKKLIKDFPLCFQDTDKGPKESLMCFGCECGDGWYKIIREACAKAEPLIKKWVKDNPTSDFKPRLVQVKEKYGTLRMYWSSYPDGLSEIEEEAEKKSIKTCETCGKEGQIRGEGWLYTACLKHTKPEDLNNLDLVEELAKKRKLI